MNSSRSLRKLQYNPNNINQDLRITSQPELPYYGFHLGIGTGPSETPVNVTMRSQAGMSGLTEAENGACFLQLTPAASQFRPGPIILPPQPVQNNFHHGITTSISLDRQPTLFTKDASPQRKAAELNNVLGDTSGRLDSKAKVIPSDLGNLKRPKSAPSSPVILLEQAKSRARVELDLLLDSGSCVEGGYVKGRVLVNVRVPHKKEGPIYLGEGKVRVVGFEAIPQNDERHTFYHCGAPFNKISPFCHMLYTSPPDDEGFCRGREESQSVPFAMRLPQRRTEFPIAKGVYNSRVNGSSIRYIAMFSIKIKDTRTNARSIAHCYRTIEVWPLFDPKFVLAPASTPLYASTSKALFFGGTGTVKLTASLHRATWIAGQRCYVRVFVANDTEKRSVQSLSLTLIRAETIFKPNPDAAMLSPSGTRISNDLDACRTSTSKRIVAKSELEMGEKVAPRHATAKGWWTGVAAGTSQEFNHFILLPPFALTIPRSRLIEVSFVLEVGISTGPLASDVTVQLPIRIINNISIDPPPAFGPPEKLCNLPPTPQTVPSIEVPVSSNIGVKSLYFSPELDLASPTLARPQPSYIYTESGTYRGDNTMPPLGKLEVRNRGSTMSGTIDGQSSSILSRSVVWGREAVEQLSKELENALEETNNGNVESGRCPHDDDALSKHIAIYERDREETSSLDEYLQGPKPPDHTHEELLSISPDHALQLGDSSDEDVDQVMRSLHPNGFVGVGEITGQPFLPDIEDEQQDEVPELDIVLANTRSNSPISSQQSSTDASSMFSSRAPPHTGIDSSKPTSVASSRTPSVFDSRKRMELSAPSADATQDWNLRSPPPRTRFLPQRPKPHPALTSKIATHATTYSHLPVPRSKGTTLRNSMELSRAKAVATTAKSSAHPTIPGQIPRSANVSDRQEAFPFDVSTSQPQLSPLPTNSKHAKTFSSATSSNIPTSISALMLQNLKTPIPAPPLLPYEQRESLKHICGSEETQRFGSQTVGPSTRVLALESGSLIKSRIALFEQGHANHTAGNVRRFQSTRNTGRAHINGMRM